MNLIGCVYHLLLSTIFQKRTHQRQQDGNVDEGRERFEASRIHPRKMLQFSPRHLQPPKLPPQPNPPPSLPPPHTSVNLPKFSRRELALCTNLLLLGSQPLITPSKSLADETPTQTPNPICYDKGPTQKAFLDVSIDGEPAGRIVIGLYGEDMLAGAGRFSKLVSGAAGISYRRKEFIKITPNYVQHGGVRSYGVDAEMASKNGGNLTNQTLIEEWESASEMCPGTKNLAGTVGIIVRNPSKPPPNMKLVARKGKLEIDQEEAVKDPNGTEFVMLFRDSPELDSSVLVIGRVLEGMEAVQRIGQVKTVQENTSSPYFRVAKLIGDKRAVVAERGFNRPYLKVLVTNCGLLN